MIQAIPPKSIYFRIRVVLGAETNPVSSRSLTPSVVFVVAAAAAVASAAHNYEA